MASAKPENDPPRPAAGQAMSTAARAHLECVAGPEKGQTLRVAPNTTVLGRDATCDIILAETAISRQHARIERRGDQWVLVNLSTNGTLLNKKPVDEAPLSDRDEIRLGASTRLKFVIETVSLSTTGRPQFRRRVSAQQEEEAKTEETAPAAEETKPSLFARRKKLFIGLAIYIGVLLIALIWGLFFRGGTMPQNGEIPVLGRDQMVIPAPGARPLRIIDETPEGMMCESPIGDPVLVPLADFQTHKARVVPGIAKALDVKFTFEINAAQAEQCRKEAIQLYQIRYLPGKEGALFNAVRRFQQSLAYSGGRGYFEDQSTNKMYQEALKELINIVDQRYSKAVIKDKAGEAKEARAMYDGILRIVPERENVIYRNVAQRIDDLKRRHPEVK
jgi:pSer/pThr/pTyr-binding forkhead associated (FHA) protein